MSALIQVFSKEAPADKPFTPEMAASIATAFANNRDDSKMPQYATAIKYIDAFVEYIAVLDTELGSPVGDSIAFVMEKHGAAITENENTNIALYLEWRLEVTGGL